MCGCEIEWRRKRESKREKLTFISLLFDVSKYYQIELCSQKLFLCISFSLPLRFFYLHLGVYNSHDYFQKVIVLIVRALPPLCR